MGSIWNRRVGGLEIPSVAGVLDLLLHAGMSALAHFQRDLGAHV